MKSAELELPKWDNSCANLQRAKTLPKRENVVGIRYTDNEGERLLAVKHRAKHKPRIAFAHGPAVFTCESVQ